MANNKPRGKHARVETLTNELFEQDSEVEVEDGSSAAVEQQKETQTTPSEAVGESNGVADDGHDVGEGASDETAVKPSDEEASMQITDGDDASDNNSEADDATDADETVALGDAVDVAEQATVAIDPIDSPEPFEAPAMGELAVGSDFSGIDVPSMGFEEGAAPGFVSDFDVPKNKSRKIGKIIGITLGSIVGVLAIAYVAVALVFSNWFLPNTTIGDMDISLKSSDEVAAMIDDAAANYTLDVVGDGFSYRTDAKGVGLSADSNAIVRTMHEDLSGWMWPVLIMQPSHDEAGRFEITFKQALYQDGVKAAVEKFNETATPPTNATIQYDEATNSFKVKPEEIGTQLDTNAVLSAMAEAIGGLNPKVTLGEEQLLQPKIFADDPKLKESAELASGMIKAKLTLNLAGQEVGTISADELAQFVSMNEETYEVTLDQEALNEWVENLADGFNTVESERTYTREDGKVVTVSGGVYGWEVDTEALRDAIIDGVKSGSSTTIDIPCSQEADVYNGPGERDWGSRYIDVDLSEQYVRFFDDGEIIWEAPCISGKPDGVHDTNTGVYVINNKKSPEKLEGYENGVKIYTSYVTYWMPFVGNAIGLHDADWQPSFGGSMYANGYGSHGCVNLPPYAAAELFGIVEIGDVVVSHW